MRILGVASLSILAVTPVAAQTRIVEVSGRFAPVRIELTVHGDMPLGTMENDCAGAVGREPVVVLRYDPGTTPVRGIDVRLESTADTVLGVLVPGERMDSSGGPAACGDDEGGGGNPLVRLHDPVAGEYRIMAGPWEQGATAAAVLTVSPAE